MAGTRSMGMEERRRYWKQHVEAWRSSGLSRRAYCLEHGLTAKTFSYWCRKKKPGDITFVPIPLERSVILSDRGEAAPISLVCKGGYRVEIPAGFDPETLRSVLSVLAEA